MGERGLNKRRTPVNPIASVPAKREYVQSGFCFYCLSKIEALQPGGLSPRHVMTKTPLCREHNSCKLTGVMPEI